MFKAFLHCFIALGFEEAWSRPVTQSCFIQTKSFGFNSEIKAWDFSKEQKMQTNMDDIYEMSLMKAAYSRPLYFIVCASDEYIHGI